jgi:hypothetical protein
VTPAGYADADCDGTGGACDGGCLSGCDRCDDGSGRSFLHHGADSDGGIRILFGNQVGGGSGESDGAVRHSHGSGHTYASRKCRECNGRGCRHCRRYARGAHGVGAGGGFGDGFHNGGIHCPHGYIGNHCPICTGRAFVNDNHVASFLGAHAARYRARNMMASQSVNAYLRCKLGYFLHDGAGGVGVMPVGYYSIVYPNNPGYFDGRDGQVYAAHGYGGPISVPLAPVVRQTYNYGWGIPSSRLTPISHPVY